MTWRLLDTGPGPGARQMAIDEALLEAVVHHQSPPALHLFAFDPVCLSLGRFQGWQRQPASTVLNSIDAVRRPTGGTAVLHAGDLCYATVAPVDDHLVGGSPRQSYRRLALAFRTALTLLGASPDPARSGQHEAGNRPLAYRVPGMAPRLPACFAALGPFEITVAGVKVVGSAQARRGQAFLQQGSLRLAADRGGEAQLLMEAPPTLSDLLGRPVTYAEAAAALRRAFADTLDVAFTDSLLTAEEECLAQTLEEEKYASAAWTWER